MKRILHYIWDMVLSGQLYLKLRIMSRLVYQIKYLRKIHWDFRFNKSVSHFSLLKVLTIHTIIEHSHFITHFDILFILLQDKFLQ